METPSHRKWRLDPKNKKKLAEYHKKFRDKNRERSRLKSRISDLKKKGLTLEDFDRMMDDQNNSCKICRIHQSDLSRKLHIDHCHSTGKVRGLLCQQCNHLLGNARDNILVLESAIKYLKESI